MATLLVALVILVILALIVLGSSSVAFFEQKTGTNEYRQRLADQAAEYALNLGGEFFKANVVNVASEETDGWLATGTARWIRCSSITPTGNHPCLTEPNTARRAQLYFYSQGGSTAVPFNSLVPAGAQLGNVGGVFSAGNTQVTALLCRLDTTITTVVSGTATPTPQCRATPSVNSTNRIAITVISRSTLTGESSASEMKGTWGNFDTFSTGAAVPLVASGTVDGTGNVEIVTAANGGGTGIPVSIWSASDADVDKTGGGSAASVSTCQEGEFLQGTPESQLMTTCATVNNACGCDSPTTAATKEMVYAKNPDFLSGHVPGAANCCENIDVLDIDGNKGASPDIKFYPGKGLDDFNVADDDSLFEWIFGVSGESNTTRTDATASGTNWPNQGPTLQTCGSAANQNCAIYYLTSADQLNAQQITCAGLNALGSSASGLYYVTDSSSSNECSLPSQVGTPDAPALVVVNDKARLNNTLLYGMLFVRSNSKTALMRAQGNAQVYGSVVIEGSTDISGGFRIVYVNASISKPGKKLPETTRFGFVPGSWLDGAKAGF